MLRLLLFICVFPLFAVAQSPEIRYATPQIYILDRTIVPLIPENAGGPVPAVIHNEVSTFAGSGAAGGLDGRGTSATFQNPSSITSDDDGNLYVTDAFRSTIRKINTQGDVTTIAGGGMATFANGNGKKAYFSSPFGIVRNKSGNLFVSDANNNQVRKISPSADVTTFAGSLTTGRKDGLGAAATFFRMVGIAIDASGNLYVADSGNSLVRKITSDGNVSTFAGSGATGRKDGFGLNASFNGPVALTADQTGNIYVSDYYNNLIRKITPEGMVSTWAGGFKNPWGLAADRAGNIYVADYNNHLIRKVTADGRVTIIAGNRTIGSVDGPSLSASFNNPIGLAIDKSENLYVADFLNNKIRKITLGGYTIDGPLPAGLTFDPKTGTVAGTPIEIWPETAYTITGYNIYGSSATRLTIEVSESILTAAKIPNAFSPNGDGVNDAWSIKGLQHDPQCEVLVFSRSGTIVFQSDTGYTRSWDGRYKGQDLPAGTYYYLLRFSDGQKKSGSLNIFK